MKHNVSRIRVHIRLLESMHSYSHLDTLACTNTHGNGFVYCNSYSDLESKALVLMQKQRKHTSHNTHNTVLTFQVWNSHLMWEYNAMRMGTGRSFVSDCEYEF